MIEFGNMDWEADLIQETFNYDDARAILAIPLSVRLLEDTISWAFTDGGVFRQNGVYGW